MAQILVLSDNVGIEYVSRIYSGARRLSGVSGYSVGSKNLHGTQTTVEEVLEDSSISAVILTAPLCDDRRVLALLEARRMPFARVAPMLDLDRGICVTLDEYEAARQVANHLVEMGHKRMAILRGPARHLVSIRRFNGFSHVLGLGKTQLDTSLMAEGDFSRESGREQASKLFAARPTAIFACNDEMAVGVMEAAKAAGIAIPGDISIVGYDDNAIAQQVTPRLTSVRQPLEKLGEQACRDVVDAIASPHKRPVATVFQLDLVERESVKRLAD